MFQIFNLRKFNLVLLLIILSVGFQDYFIEKNFILIFNANYIWVIRFFVIIIIFLFQINNYKYYNKVEIKNIILFVPIFMSIIINSHNIDGSLIKYLFGHYFYIHIIFFLFQSKHLINDSTVKLIGYILILLGFLSSYCSFDLALKLNIDYADSLGLNFINFPAWSFLGIFILFKDRPYLFSVLVLCSLVIFISDEVRSASLATIIFFLIVSKKDFKIFNFFSYSSLILFSLLMTLFVSIIEFDTNITSTISTGRGHIWAAHWMQFKNFNIEDIMFGGKVDYEILKDLLSQYSQINVLLDNFFQIHSVSLKTLLDYGIIGFLFIMLIFKNKKQDYSDKLFNLSNAIFFFCLAISSLNSSTNFIKFDIYGLLMLIALSISNQKYLKNNVI